MSSEAINKQKAESGFTAGKPQDSSPEGPAENESVTQNLEADKKIKRIGGVRSLESIHKELTSDTELRKAFSPKLSTSTAAKKSQASDLGASAYPHMRLANTARSLALE